MLTTISKEHSRPMFKLSAETDLLIRAIENINDNEVSYDTLSMIAGFKVSGAHPALTSARKHLEREKQQVWHVRRTWGIFLADTVQTIEIRVKDNKSGRKKFRRSRKRGRWMTDAEFNALPLSLQERHLLTQAEAEAKALPGKQKVPDKTFEAINSSQLDIKAAVAALLKK